MTNDLYYRKLESTSTLDLVDMLREKDGRIEQYEKDLINFDENLTKAKEIIKGLLQVLPKENIEGIYEVTEVAEEFLVETEKWERN